ncbi:hypothetical protein C4K04_1465 [Pseudomonas chlororaphis]|uniref:Uncharacterized protein n=1 Tax=Pseudomonas chlororaphis TaxID=587753 RepID=A0A3G7TJ87_9PSED|nr:hypothetical protein C4K04_1465 [Pseudomonas chlororaphis]
MRLRVMSAKPLQLHQLLQHFHRQALQPRTNKPALRLRFQQPLHLVRRLLMVPTLWMS